MLGTVRGLARDPRFGAADYRDVVDGTTVFRLGAPIPVADDGGAAAVASIDAWTADGGGDTPRKPSYWPCTGSPLGRPGSGPEPPASWSGSATPRRWTRCALRRPGSIGT